MSEIVFPASVARVRTLVDGGIRLELDLPEDCIPQMAMLAETRREGIALVFIAKVDGEPDKQGKSRRDRQRCER